MYQMSQGNASGYCSSCSGCGGCSSGGSYGDLENIAASEVSYQGSSGSTPNYSEVSMGNSQSYTGTSNPSSITPGISYASSPGTLVSGYGSFFKGPQDIFNIGLVSSYQHHDLLKQTYNQANEKTEILNQFLTKINESYSFVPNNFLKPNRISQKFVGQAEEVKDFVQETFIQLTGLEFPDDIRIQICSKSEFKKLTSNPGVVGLSINRKEEGLISDIFILEDQLDKVMLTIGHEIGHVLARSLPDRRSEEAKAFAFSFAWMKTIKKHNIADLGQNIVFDNPAQNGIHDIAFSFVAKLIKEGKQDLELYWELVRKVVCVPFCS